MVSSIFLYLGTLAIATSSYCQNLRIPLDGIHAYNLIAIPQLDTLDTSSNTSHGTYFLLVKDNSITIASTNNNLLLAISLLNANQLVIIIQLQSNNAQLTAGIELGQLNLLDNTLASSHKEEFGRIVLPYLQYSSNLLSLVQLQKVNQSCTPSLAAGFSNLICLEIVYPATAGKEQDSMMSSGNKNILHKVTFLGGHTQNTLTATVLLVIGIQLHALDIVVVTDSQHHILVSDKIFLAHFGHIIGNGSAAGITIFLLDRSQLFLDNGHNLAFISQYRLQPFNFLQNFLILLLNLFPLQTGKTLETQIKDSLSLLLRQLEAIHQSIAGNISSLGLTNSGNYCIQMIQSNGQALQNMSSGLCLGQLISGSSGNNILLMLDVIMQYLLQSQNAWLVIHQSQHNYTKGILQLSMLV